MKADDPRAAQWRAAMAQVLETSTITQADLARAIDRTQQQMSDWMSGRANPPTPDVVFAIEDVLGCPDRLAQVLGYVRARPVDTETSLERDPRLDEIDRLTLLRLYRYMSQQLH
jgi:transcriptional regulator with XRE-family HTH domain